MSRANRGEIETRMTCAEAQRLLLEEHRPDQCSPAVAEHLQRCPGCRRLRSQLLLLDGVIKEQAPELPADFELSLRRKLQASAEKLSAAPASKPRWRWMALASAALVLVTAATVWIAERLRHTSTPVTYHRLHLAIRSPEDYKEALFDVDLPEGVRPLAGTAALFGRGRNLQWRAAVRRGLNEIDLPLVATRVQGEVQIRLRVGARLWTGHVAFGSGQLSGSSTAPSLELALLLSPGGEKGGAP